jgi:hypothetical protein
MITMVVRMQVLPDHQPAYEALRDHVAHFVSERS